MSNSFLPEGMLLGTASNLEYITSLQGIERALNDGTILESIVTLCDNSMRLHVDMYGIKGIVEKSECMYCRNGEEIKDIAIITRVGKPICFKVIGIEFSNGKPIARLSRRLAQEECIRMKLNDLAQGDIVRAKVTHLENFGAFG